MKGLLILFILASCRSGPSSSDQKIINAAKGPVLEEWKSTFSAVVRVKTTKGGICSGTFVRPDTMITAAHCTADERDVIGHGVSVRGVPSSQTITALNISNVKDENRIYDLAVIKFNRNISTTTTFPRIQPASPTLGSTVIIAGFGRTTPEGGAGDFNWGTNILAAQSKSFLRIQGTAKPVPGRDSLSSHGDSGGPMFNRDHHLIAVTRGGRGDDEEAVVNYIWLGSESSRSLLRRAGLVQ